MIVSDICITLNYWSGKNRTFPKNKYTEMDKKYRKLQHSSIWEQWSQKILKIDVEIIKGTKKVNKIYYALNKIVLLKN